MAWRIAALLLLLAVGAGCHQHMLKATPFWDREHEQTIGAPEDRINLWPLAYHRAPVTSILWPIGEVTDNSWAVRPLVASYDDQLDLIWPLWHQNFAEHSGHCFPLAVWDRDKFQSWLCQVHYSDAKRGFVSPLYTRTTEANGRDFLFTPFYARETTPTSTTTALPLLLTAWGNESNGDSWLFNPLFANKHEGGERVFGVPLLLTGFHRSDAGGHGGTVLLIAHYSRSENAATDWLLPLYARHRRDADRWTVAPPLLSAWGGSGENDRWVMTPIFAGSRSATVVRRFVPPFLTWWSRTPEGELRDLNVLLSLYGRRERPGRSSSHFFPFYWQRRADDFSYSAFIPFYVATENSRGSSLFVPPVLSFFESSNDGAHSASLLGPLVGWGHGPPMPEGDGYASRHWHLFPLYSYHRRHESVRQSYALGFASTARSEHHARWNAGWFLAGGRHSPGRRSHYCFPLYDAESVDYVAEKEFRDQQHPERATAAKPEADAAADKIKIQAEQKFSFLFLLYDRVARRLSTDETYTRHRVLWRLYHDETQGPKRSIDVFPFITYDRDGADALTWSWLYKFVRYERRGVGRALNLLFLPAIRWGE
ncbi:MAG: hypothetical protein ACKVX7_16685 [Planctomycetota bacterium]